MPVVDHVAPSQVTRKWCAAPRAAARGATFPARAPPRRDLHRGRARPPRAALHEPRRAGLRARRTCPRRSRARCSRATRAIQGTLRRLFLDEFADSLPEPGAAWDGDEGAAPRSSTSAIFLGYGDDSVAQLGGAHVACEWVSNVLTKILQRPRLGAYLEQSTRYIAYDAPMPGGGYRYYRDADARTGVRARDGRALRDLRALAAARDRLGRRDLPARRRRLHPPRTRARCRPRRWTCCAACCRRPRCRTWASSRRARPTSS